jgi:hypothetical protein
LVGSGRRLGVSVEQRTGAMLKSRDCRCFRVASTRRSWAVAARLRGHVRFCMLKLRNKHTRGPYQGGRTHGWMNRQAQSAFV